MPNRLTFDGPVEAGQPDAPSSVASIQKFMWWDARIDEPDRETSFSYTAWPVVGSASAPQLLEAQRTQLAITLPAHIEDGIGTWFNRAVVSSQAFTRKVAAMGLDPKKAPLAGKALVLRRWLANDIEQSFPTVFQGASPAASAIYHLADKLWAIPALEDFAKTHDAHSTAGWSDSIRIGSALLRASFSPEPNDRRTQIDTIVDAVGQAEHSVLFCLFSPTDKPLRDACFAAGDKGLMMFGLDNAISQHAAESGEKKQKDGEKLNATELASIELYHRSRQNRHVVDGKCFSRATVPEGFDVEMQLFPGETRPPYPPVIIHHKFLVIDAEGANPVVYTGSANMSNNSEHDNDENLLEIRDRRIAAIYLAEFLRLYEHHRARALAIEVAVRRKSKPELKLQPDRHWADKYYVEGSPESKARVALAKKPSA
ncbi:phospholipase D/transphosphatidylase [Caballeronia ptereochthonis]|uniref:phospholipase D n=1 Tax=Caballeronia ptereochthonis TaxID=1777144 RepID=A0A158E1B0_9BURK|nr:phospholipase D/transphosphatidylase [Caballeronia ptereochthonis]